MNDTNKQDNIVNYLKNYGFVFQNSEIYNGLANAWDYGPLGVLLKNNIKKEWWKTFVLKDPNVVGLDSAILMNKNVWKASGHLENFSDPLIDCKDCKSRFRADKLLEEKGIIISENTENNIVQELLAKHNITCPNCTKFNWTDIRKFNLMFKTNQGVIVSDENELYLRPETAQGIFINFKNIQRTSRLKLPFGVGQIGKAFRNEITPKNFIFRTREFEQMELEYFCLENQKNDIFNYLQNKIHNFLLNICCIKKENLKIYDHPKDDLSHYSSKTIDFEYNYPHGFSELWGIADRGNYDLTVHSNYSKKDLSYLDPDNNIKLIPYIIEPSVGVERLLYAIVCDCYEIEKISQNDEREILKINPKLAPYYAAILPLNNKLKDEAFKIYEKFLELGISVTFDSSGSIGKRYRRQDAIGTPYCITVDFDTVNDNNFTIRFRDSMEQVRINFETFMQKYLIF